MGFNYMTAFMGLMLLWGAVWLPIFFVLIICTVLGVFNPFDMESRRKWRNGTWVAFFVVLGFYLIILSRSNVGLN